MSETFTPNKRLKVYVDVPPIPRTVPRTVMDYVDIPSLPGSSSKPKTKPAKSKTSVSQNRTIDNYFTSKPAQKQSLPAPTKTVAPVPRPAVASIASSKHADINTLVWRITPTKQAASQAHRLPHKRALSDRPINVEVVDLTTPPKKRKIIDDDDAPPEKPAKKVKTAPTAKVDAPVPAKKVQPTSTPAQQNKPVVKRVRKKVVPKWTPVEGFEDQEEIVSRIQLREFLIRFRPILKLAKSHYEGLDEFSAFTEDTAKAIVKALLDLIVVDATGEERSYINTTIKSISSCGTDLYRMWPHLQKLCTNTFHLDLLTPAASPAAKETRTSSYVMHPEQLVDCMLDLIDVALNGPSIRAEIQEGEKDLKDKTRDWLKAVRDESERWSEQRGKLLFTKPANSAAEATKDEQAKQQQLEKAYKANYAQANKEHKANLRAINGDYLQATFANASRFGPLGRDHDGRVYYILSPVHRGRVPANSTRDALTKWAWFVACFGKRPKLDDSDKAHDDDDGDDKWWGFADFEEIRKLAKWIEATETTDEAPHALSSATIAPPSGAEIVSLCKGLNGFADYLDWRTAGHEEEPPTKKEVPAKRFYGS